MGIDTDLAGFNDESLCLITANEGNIDYREERDKTRIIVSDKDFKNKDIIKKILLRKSLHWKYEKEVRVVIESEKLLPIENEEDKFYLYKAPGINSIKEIYIGINNDEYEFTVTDNENLRNAILKNNIKIQKCNFKKGTWDLDSMDYDMKDITNIEFNALARVISAFEKNEV
ncbi:Uncharacterised protein [Klebsiella pneumoniae]|nr:Uncharacterised protein [Klebsiella pneumoniae]